MQVYRRSRGGPGVRPRTRSPGLDAGTTLPDNGRALTPSLRSPAAAATTSTDTPGIMHSHQFCASFKHTDITANELFRSRVAFIAQRIAYRRASRTVGRRCPVFLEHVGDDSRYTNAVTLSAAQSSSMTKITRRTKGQSTRLLRFAWGLIVVDKNPATDAGRTQVFHVVPVKLKLRHQETLKNNGSSFAHALATLRPGLLRCLPDAPEGVNFSTVIDGVEPIDRNELFAIVVNASAAGSRVTEWLSAFAQADLADLMVELDRQLARLGQVATTASSPAAAGLTQRIATWTRLHAIDPLAARLGAATWSPQPGTQQGSLLIPRPSTLGGAA